MYPPASLFGARVYHTERHPPLVCVLCGENPLVFRLKGPFFFFCDGPPTHKGSLPTSVVVASFSTPGGGVPLLFSSPRYVFAAGTPFFASLMFSHLNERVSPRCSAPVGYPCLPGPPTLWPVFRVPGHPNWAFLSAVRRPFSAGIALWLGPQLFGASFPALPPLSTNPSGPSKKGRDFPGPLPPSRALRLPWPRLLSTRRVGPYPLCCPPFRSAFVVPEY